jgi:hypothetical protein
LHSHHRAGGGHGFVAWKFLAAVLNFVVEPNTQRRHEDLERAVTERLTRASDDLNLEVRKNVLRAVFKQNLGDNVIGQIESKLFQPTPYRIATHIAYSLTLMTDGQSGKQCVRVEATLRYLEINASRRKVALVVGLTADSPEEFGHLLTLDAIKVDGRDVIKEDLRKKMINGGSIVYRDENVIDMEPGAKHAVEIPYCRGDYAAGTETHVSRLAVETLEVFVSHSPELRVWAMSLHPDEPDDLPGTGTLKGWRLRGLVPGQGIAISWGPVVVNKSNSIGASSGAHVPAGPAVQ